MDQKKKSDVVSILALIVSIGVLIFVVSDKMKSPNFKSYKDPKTINRKPLTNEELKNCTSNLSNMYYGKNCSICGSKEPCHSMWRAVIMNENVIESRCLNCGHIEYFSADKLLNAKVIYANPSKLENEDDQSHDN